MIEYMIRYWYTLKLNPTQKEEDQEPKTYSESFIVDLNPREEIEHQALIAARQDFEEKHSAALIWYVDTFAVESIKKL